MLVNRLICRKYANCMIGSPDALDLHEVSGRSVTLVTELDAAIQDEVRVASWPVRAITAEA